MAGGDRSDESMREYLSMLLAERERRLQDRFEAMDKALNLAAAAADRQFHNLNELRKEVMQDRNQFVQREVHDAKDGEMHRWREAHTSETVEWRKRFEHRVGALETRIQIWAAIIAVLVVLGQAFFRHFFK